MRVINPYVPSVKQWLPGIKKPGYRWQSQYSIVVPASINSPVHLVLGENPVKVTSNLECNLTIQGSGGLDRGSLAASTPYYLYAVVTSNDLRLVASLDPPTTGLQTFSTWSYIGAFCTDQALAIVTPFVSTDGLYIADNELYSVSHTGGITPQVKSLPSLPTTTKQVWGFMTINGATINTAGRVMGYNVSSNNALYQLNLTTTSANASFGYVPIFTAQTVYLQLETAGNNIVFYQMGWKEDPSEFK